MQRRPMQRPGPPLYQIQNGLRLDQVGPTLLDPSNILTYGKLHEPVALSKYIVEKSIARSWISS